MADYLKSVGKMGGILCAGTGQGKTVMSLEIARRLNGPTLIKVYKEDLAHQWIQRINQFFPNATVGRIQADSLDYEGKDFVLAMIQTLASREEDFLKDKKLRNYFVTEITDECHRTGSQSWGKTAGIFNSRYRLGLSATPYRKDNAEKVFEYHIGKVVVRSEGTSLNPKIYFKETGFDLFGRMKYADIPLPTIQNIIAKNNARNILIVNMLVKALKAGRKIIAIAHRVKHLQALQSLLHIKTNDFTSSLYVGAIPIQKEDKNGNIKEVKQKQSMEDLEKAKEADCMFCTYKKAEDALDVPALDTLFMTSPISDPTQVIGRILRPFEDKKDPLVVDFTDDSLSIFRGLKIARTKLYTRKGWSTHTMRGN
jgi:superfamily II DNA or RNA helicase